MPRKLDRKFSYLSLHFFVFVCVSAAIDDAFCIFPDKNSALELLSNKCLFDVLLCPIFVVEKSSYCLLLRYNSGNKQSGSKVVRALPVTSSVTFLRFFCHMVVLLLLMLSRALNWEIDGNKRPSQHIGQWIRHVKASKVSQFNSFSGLESCQSRVLNSKTISNVISAENPLVVRFKKSLYKSLTCYQFNHVSKE